MAKLITDVDEIDRISKAKQQLEQQLVKELYQQFNQGDAIAILRVVVDKGMREMRHAVDKGGEIAIIEALIDESFLDVLQKYISDGPDVVGNLENLIGEVNNFNASECGEIIRLLGAWVEKSKGDPLEVQAAYRPGVVPWKPDKAVTDATEITGWAGQYWEEGYDAVWANGRTRGKFERRDVEAHVKDTKGPTRQGGMETKRAWKSSTILKIDRLFGLLVGADISGTTADTIAALERWGTGLLHPYYYLFPVATLVYNFHHTLLEVALLLSLNKISDYQIGVYTSLLPPESGPVPSELSAIPAILQKAENDERNKHFIIFYDEGSSQEPQKKPACCILFEDETQIVRDKSQQIFVALRVLALAQRYQPFPTQKDAVDLIQRLAPPLYGSLPSDMKFSPRRSAG